jgi:hypothetical protein
MNMRACLASVFSFLTSLASMGAAQAEDVGVFYRSRAVDMIIGFTPGGGYDL